MKRLAVNGNERHPNGAEYLLDGSLGGVAIGDIIVVYLEDEPDVEADAIVEFYPGWGSGWFGRGTSEWRRSGQ